MFNRYYNYVVIQFVKINENGCFNKLGMEVGSVVWEKYDNDLFQIGCFIICGFYVNIIFYDYMRLIFVFNYVDMMWSFDFCIKFGKNMFSQLFFCGVGN